MNNIENFKKHREKINKIIMEYSDTNIKRFFALDNAVYKNGVFDRKTKEFMGLIASLVLRCDECIKYHIIRCIEEDAKMEEFVEVFSIALIVGGSITIPHIRNAYELLEEFIKKGNI